MSFSEASRIPDGRYSTESLSLGESMLRAWGIVASGDMVPRSRLKSKEKTTLFALLPEIYEDVTLVPGLPVWRTVVNGLTGGKIIKVRNKDPITIAKYGLFKINERPALRVLGAPNGSNESDFATVFLDDPHQLSVRFAHATTENLALSAVNNRQY